VSSAPSTCCCQFIFWCPPFGCGLSSYRIRSRRHDARQRMLAACLGIQVQVQMPEAEVRRYADCPMAGRDQISMPPALPSLVSYRMQAFPHYLMHITEHFYRQYLTSRLTWMYRKPLLCLLLLSCFLYTQCCKDASQMLSVERSTITLLHTSCLFC